MEDYCNTIGMEHQQISNDWSILRSSCLSNINDIILTLGIHSNRYILQILDIALDLRKNSKTFGKSFKIILSDKNCLSLYIPEGFAHAYYS